MADKKAGEKRLLAHQKKITSLFKSTKTDETHFNVSNVHSSKEPPSKIQSTDPVEHCDSDINRPKREKLFFTTATHPSVRQIDVLFQPENFDFPKRAYGKEERSFREIWFKHENWKDWLHYDVETDSAFCFTCVKAVERKMVSCSKAEKAFVLEGFSNWKNAATKGRGFDKHVSSQSHQEAIERLNKIPATCRNVGNMISSIRETEMSNSRQCLLKILSNIRFLARQALPLRGTGDEKDSNFHQVYKLRAEDNPLLEEWLSTRKTNKYVHHDIQNEMMQIMALSILREIASDVGNSDFFTMMCDEATDVSNVSQLVICLRWVDEDLVVHDEYIGLKDMSDTGTNANSIVRELKDVLLRMKLKLDKCRGQCYDGCSTMTGAKNGVVVKIKEEEARALYTHCYSHSLNLAVGDTMKKSKFLKDVIDTTIELTKLVKKSPKRDAKLKNLQSDMADTDFEEEMKRAVTVTLFCPTRWTVRAESLNAIIENFDFLQELWKWSLNNCEDTEMKIRIRGMKNHTLEFNYSFGIHLAHLVLSHTDNLSKTLQSTEMSAIEGQEVASYTVQTLKKLRNDEQFELFYKKVSAFAAKHDVNDPKLPRKCNAPIRYFFGKAPGEHPETAEDDYRRKYFEALDLAINCIEDRFEQNDYKMYACCEQVLLKACCGDDFSNELNEVLNFYKDDFNEGLMKVQLNTLPAIVKDVTTFKELRKCVKALSRASKSLISQVIKLIKLVLVMPATNAVSERSFSAMRRLYKYTRTNMSQNRLNHTMTLHIHKERLDSLSLIDVANEFVGPSEHRNLIFGQFSNEDSRRGIVSVISRGTQTS